MQSTPTFVLSGCNATGLTPGVAPAPALEASRRVGAGGASAVFEAAIPDVDIRSGPRSA